jgi:raffinose/stachyose/melibiose transport system permease protein
MYDKIIKKSYPMYMMMPIIILFTVFFFGSVLGLFVFSMTNWNMANAHTSFVGLDNFKMLFTDDHFISAFKNTWIFMLITTTLKVGLGLALALVLDMKLKGRNFFRAIFYMPCIISMLIIGYIFNFVLQPDVGLLDSFLKIVHLGFLQKNWLGDMKIVLYSVCSIEVWTYTGWSATIFLAGLQTIPKELVEAATIDGANCFDVFRKIKMHILFPAFNVVLTMNIIGGFRVFDIIMATTNGGPGYATEVFSSLIYKANGTGAMGYASSIGLVQFILITIIVLPLLQFLRKKEIEL